MRLLELLNHNLNKILAAIAGVSLVGMMLVVVGNIIMRAVYVPFGATSEVVGWLAALSTGFALGYAQINKAHVTIDLLVEKFPRRLQSLVEGVVLLFSMAFFALVTWQVFLYARRLQQMGSLSETMRLPYYYFVYAVAIGLACLMLALAVDLVRNIRGVVRDES